MAIVAELPVSESGTVEALKRVKATEAEWETAVAQARAHRDAALRADTDAAARAVQAAQAQVERDRTEAVQAARTEGDAEAARVLAEADKTATAAARDDPDALEARRTAILAAVLGRFLSD